MYLYLTRTFQRKTSDDGGVCEDVEDIEGNAKEVEE